MLVSRFNNIFQTKEVIKSNLLDELRGIKEGKYKSIIEQCRFYTRKKDYDSYKSLKIKLPIVTFCGTFKGGRKLENLVEYNGVMILDIDDIEMSKVDALKAVLSNDQYIYSTWKSPSNEGLKALVKVDSTPSEHKSSFDSLKIYFKEKYEIELDNSGSDITRLCFVSWDEELFLNTESVVYRGKLNQEPKEKKTVTKNTISRSLSKSAFATEGLNKKEHRKIVANIIKFLKKKDLSITSSFDEWFRVALAVSGTFSYDVGEKYYLGLCELDKERHNELESKNILKYCYNNRKLGLNTSVTFGTIIFYAKQKGFITRSDKLSQLEK